MRYNEDLLNKFLNGTHAVAVRTEQEWIDFMELLESETKCLWRDRKKPTNYNDWKDFESESSIAFNFLGDNSITYDRNRLHKRKGYKIIEFKDLIKKENVKNECLKCNQKQREIDKMQTEINDLHLMLANRDKEISRLTESNNKLKKNNKKLKSKNELEFKKRKLHGMYGNKKEKQINPSKNFYDSIHDLETKINEQSKNIHNSHYLKDLDTIDRAKELAKITNLDHFEFSMQYNIDKYNLRMGKKDDKLKELDKIIDYAQIWKDYLQNE